MKIIFILWLTVSLKPSESSHLPECPIVKFANGKVKGITTKAKHEDAKPVFNYNAIPFGKPPVNKLRFMPPEPYTDVWTDVLDGTLPKNAPVTADFLKAALNIYVPMDLSKNYSDSEDCLNLNVYTPDTNPTANLSVMVWLYGGGFAMGSNQQYDGTVLAGLNNVVVVMPNYRLTAFGFLSFGAGSKIPGNMGLLDQVLALKWVQQNIKQFGGNPDSVTIFGESAGAFAVGLHLNSPLSDGLFHRAILQSGVPLILDAWNNEEKILNSKNLLLQMLNITDTDENEQIKKLQNADVKDIVNAIATLFAQDVKFHPVIDGSFVKKMPIKKTKTKKTNKIPTIYGYNDSEGLGIVPSFIPGFFKGLNESQTKTLLVPILKYWSKRVDMDKVFQKILKHYSKDIDSDDPTLYSQVYGRFYGQFLFDYTSITYALDQEENQPTYMYHGAFKLKMYHDAAFSDGFPLKPSFVNCDHADEIHLEFGSPFLHYNLPFNTTFTEEEESLSLEFMTYITNFAKSGNPNIENPIRESWQKYDSENFYTMKFKDDGPKLFKNDPFEYMEFFGINRFKKMFKLIFK